MRRWMTAALVVGAVILLVEGYFVYRFYADPDTAEVRPPERPAREEEPEPAATTRPEVAEGPAAGDTAEAPARVPVEAPPEPEARPDTGPRGGQENGPAAEPDEAQYMREVGEVQERAVATFLDTHEKMRRYDGLTAEDVGVMRENRNTLAELRDGVGELEPPREHEDQHGVFASALDDLAEAAAVGYELAADPVSATSSQIEQYDRLVDEAASGLRLSNELLGTDHETLGEVQDIGT